MPPGALKGSWLIAVIAMLAAAPRVPAQSADDAWHYLVEPYLMFPNMRGTVGVGNLPNSDVDESPSDVFSHLQLGAMLYAEAHNGTWAFTSDFSYMKLGESVEPTPLIGYGRVTLKQLGWELAALYRLSPYVEAGLGAQLNSVQSELNLSINLPVGSVSRDDKMTQTWVDPALILRLTWPLTRQWYLQGRFNIAGFGAVSQFAYQVQLYAGYRFSELCSVSFGYRVIGDEYETGSGADRFLYHVTTFGPVIRFGFNF